MIGILGVWLIIASFTMNGNIVNQLIVGVTIAVLGFWSAARIQI
ncbi:MAG: SPW repeat protein [Syntrophobacterales bacterium]|nr:MAG: SPW repeat protein [Syntrophobacterales bacterium]